MKWGLCRINAHLLPADEGFVIRVTYYYSACVGIRTPDCSVLCDPWFTNGIYDGAWYQYPKLDDPLGKIGRYDFIYISHIHPDHYDPPFLHAYLEQYPGTRVLIGDYALNHLHGKMGADGIPHEVTSEVVRGDTRMRIFPTYELDSAFAVARGAHSVVNMNDNAHDVDQVDSILRWLGRRPSIALLAYTGAGPYPQTYFSDPAILEKKAQEKKREFLKRYLVMRDALDPCVTIPFAGKYVLGGRLSALNPYRGVADAVEVTHFDPTAVVLDDGGDASIDTETLVPTAVREAPYEPASVEAYIADLPSKALTADRYFGGLDPAAIPFRRLLPTAYRRAVARSACEHDHYVCIDLGKEWFVANARRGSDEFRFETNVEELEPRSELDVEPRYLFGLLTGIFHWNNAEIGSLYRTRRIPDEHHRPVQGFFNYFHV